MAVQIKNHETRRCRFCLTTRLADEFEFISKRGFRRSICRSCWDKPEARERYHKTRSTGRRTAKDDPVRTDYAKRADDLFLTALPIPKRRGFGG